MKLESKRENPILLQLNADTYYYVGKDELLPLENGVVFGDDHYGFDLTVSNAAETITTPYATQCRIYGVQIHDGVLNIFEEHKYIPWKFELNGTLQQNAVFSTLKRDETRYIAEQYGVNSEDELKKLNNYIKIKKQ